MRYYRFANSTKSGHPAEIVWIFRDDLWKRSATEVFVRVPSQPENFALAKKVFDEGRRKGKRVFELSKSSSAKYPELGEKL